MFAVESTIDANPFDKEEPKSKKDDSWMKGKDGWEILDDEKGNMQKKNKILRAFIGI